MIGSREKPHTDPTLEGFLSGVCSHVSSQLIAPTKPPAQDIGINTDAEVYGDSKVRLKALTNFVVFLIWRSMDLAKHGFGEAWIVVCRVLGYRLVFTKR